MKTGPVVKTFLALVTTLSLLLFGTNAFADDAGVWVKMDAKLNAVESGDMKFGLRATPEFEFNNTVGGLARTVARGGPTATFAPWFNLTLNGVSTSVGAGQDLRAEIQPELTFRHEGFKVNDRNRVAYRALDTAAGDRWQYANELKASYTFDDAGCNVFAAYEGYVDLSNGVMNQHRLMVGPGFDWKNGWHTDFGYMFRTMDAGPVWNNSHFLYLLLATK